MSSIFFPLSPPFSYCVLFIYYFVHSFCSNETLSSQQPLCVSHVFGISFPAWVFAPSLLFHFPPRSDFECTHISITPLEMPVQFPARLQWWIYIISMTANVGLHFAFQSFWKTYFRAVVKEKLGKNAFISNRKPLKTFNNLNDANIKKKVFLTKSNHKIFDFLPSISCKIKEVRFL